MAVVESMQSLGKGIARVNGWRENTSQMMSQTLNFDFK